MLDVVNEPADRARASMGWGTFSAMVGAVVVGTAVPVLWRHPRHPVAWVIAGTGLLWGFDGLCESYSAFGMAHTPYLPLTGFAVWVVAQLGAFLLVGLPLVLVLYPTGRQMPGRWGRLSVVAITMACALPAILLFAPMSVVGSEEPLPLDTGMPELPMSEDVFMTLLGVARITHPAGDAARGGGAVRPAAARVRPGADAAALAGLGGGDVPGSHGPGHRPAERVGRLDRAGPRPCGHRGVDRDRDPHPSSATSTR